MEKYNNFNEKANSMSNASFSLLIKFSKQFHNTKVLLLNILNLHWNSRCATYNVYGIGSSFSQTCMSFIVLGVLFLFFLILKIRIPPDRDANASYTHMFTHTQLVSETIGNCFF